MPSPRSQRRPPPEAAAPAARAAARGRVSAGARPGAAFEPATGLVLRKSPARLKLEALEKENERLLREIDKKKRSCEVTEHTVRDAHDELATRSAALRAEATEILREIHQIFDQLLAAGSRLSRGDRAALRRFHGQVISNLPRPDAARDESPENEERDPEAPPFDPGWVGEADAAEHASASKPSPKNTDSLRALYRKLALALHPDKARDASEVARLTALMKEVTQAYANEDLAKLVELERTWLAQGATSDEDELESRSARLLAHNGELRRQLRALTARLKALKQSLPGVSWPRGRRAASGAEMASEVIGELEREVRYIEGLRDAARELRAGRSSVSEFLAGPRPSLDEQEEAVNELFEEMLEELLQHAHQESRRPRGRRR